MQKNHLLIPYFFFLALALCWSLSFLAIHISINFFHPIFSAMLRIGIAFATLTILFVCTKSPLKLPFKTATLLWLQGIIGQALPFLFLFWGEQYITPGLASILNATVPLWVIVINGFILREKGTFTLKKTLGLLLGFSGIIIIFMPMISVEDQTTSAMTLVGIISVSIMAISYASGAIFYQKILGKYQVPFKASVWHQHVGSFAFVFIISLIVRSWPTASILSSFSVDALLALIYLGLFSTAFAYLMYSYLITQWGAVRAVSVVYIVPVFSVVWDLLFLHIPLHLPEVIGMIVILLGVLSVQIPDKQTE